MTRARDLASGGGVEAGEVIPHIILGVLYPAVAGKLLDGSTSHSGAYGTAQSDGKSYYYTDIKGSKPIKDPRIGGHFGSQRYTFRSAQILEQETATHGEDVWSVDGREWMRIAGNAWGTTGSGKPVHNSNAGVRIDFYNNTTAFIEIVGYFNDANLKIYADTNSDQWNTNINGGTVQAQDVSISVSTPLSGRYVDAHSLVNLAFNSAPTLGINTLKISVSTATYFYVNAIELIAQDTSSTANRSKIQIPSQNVVSYGKKFTVSGTPHYDPFNGFTNDTTLFSSVVDTATSLGLGTATTWGAPWDKGSDDHIRPFNGGRVVKWVDSSGTIKTSVTMMPANAQNIGTTASNEITTASATNSHTINFSDDAVDNSLSEVAKTFNWREFGNGAANGGTGATYADASMLAGVDNIAYVMDDGLTSLSSTEFEQASAQLTFRPQNSANDENAYLTFIGTGISATGTGSMSNTTTHHTTYAQNLPYGTHILKISRTGANAFAISIDGITIITTSSSNDNIAQLADIFFHQPKKPPIPEDAVVLADYMLMADYVNGAGGIGKISKGSRLVYSSRDFFYDENTNVSISLSAINAGYNPSGYAVTQSGGNISSGTMYGQLPYFGTSANFRCQDPNSRLETITEYINSTSLGTRTNSGTGYNEIATHANSPTLGINGIKGADTSNDFWIDSVEIATPIHSSSHYQSFETPFLHELVGGDRNMEQTNLVVTPDGKTWDEVTRDTSYISSITALCTTTDTATVHPNRVIPDEWRGSDTGEKAYFNKYFAIAYDSVICLEDGQYKIGSNLYCRAGAAGVHHIIFVNGAESQGSYAGATSSGQFSPMPLSINVTLKRGDYIFWRGEFGNDSDQWCNLYIDRLA